MTELKTASWFRPLISVQNILLLLAACFFVALFDLDKSELASWVQAIGSIAAIIAAFLIGNEQIKVQNQIREKELCTRATAFYFIVKNAVNSVRSYEFVLREHDRLNALLNWKFIHCDLMRNAKNSMSQIPSYELGSYELVDSFHQICGSIDSVISKISMKILSDTIDPVDYESLKKDVEIQWGLCEKNWFRFKTASEEIHGRIDVD